MRQNFLKSKLHRAPVTSAALDYEDSISLDRVIVAAYVGHAPEEIAGHTPRLVLLGEQNVIQSAPDHPVTLP